MLLMSSSWSDLRRRVARIGASLDVVVRSDPEVCGLSGSDYGRECFSMMLVDTNFFNSF